MRWMCHITPLLPSRCWCHCLTSITFCYDGAFGSLHSPVSVLIFMEHIENEALNMSLVPTISWKRYVLSAIPVDQVNKKLAHISSISQNIQFTSEREVGYVISSLDVEISCSADGSLTTKVYCKLIQTNISHSLPITCGP